MTASYTPDSTTARSHNPKTPGAVRAFPRHLQRLAMIHCSPRPRLR